MKDIHTVEALRADLESIIQEWMTAKDSDTSNVRLKQIHSAGIDKLAAYKEAAGDDADMELIRRVPLIWRHMGTIDRSNT